MERTQMLGLGLTTQVIIFFISERDLRSSELLAPKMSTVGDFEAIVERRC